MNPKGSTLLRPDSWARGYRDGFSGHAPRSDATGSEEYRRGFQEGQQDSARMRWLRTNQELRGVPVPVSPEQKHWNQVNRAPGGAGDLGG